MVFASAVGSEGMANELQVSPDVALGVGSTYIPPGFLFDNGQIDGFSAFASQNSDSTWFARTADDFLIEAENCSTGQFEIDRIRLQMSQYLSQPFGVDLFADNGMGTAPGGAPGGTPPLYSFPEHSRTTNSGGHYEVSFETPGLILNADTTYWISGFGVDGTANVFGFENSFMTSPGAPGTVPNGVIVAPDFGPPDWTPVHQVIFVPPLAFSFAIDGSCTSGDGPARFWVSKDFNDDNPAEVDVMIECNTGLPLEQSATISEGEPVNFVVGDFNPGELDCEITEAVPAGYSPGYDDGDGEDSTSCSYTGLSGGQKYCVVRNSVNDVEVEVTKVWIDENSQYSEQNFAEAKWICSNVARFCQARTCNESGSLQFFGNPAMDTFNVAPNWEGGTVCEVTEAPAPDGGVEIEDSECYSIILFPGDSGSCTIYNTRLYEGIPTISRLGLTILTMLILGFGFIVLRRFAW